MASELLDAAFTQPDASFWLATLLNTFLKGTLVLAAVALLAHLLRHRAAAVRYTIWSAGLLSLLAIPMLSAVLPRWHVDALSPALEHIAAPDPVRVAERGVMNEPQASEPASLDKAAPASERAQPNMGPVVREMGTTVEVSARNNSVLTAITGAVRNTVRDPNFDWTWWVVALWLAGVLIGLARLGVAHVRAYGLVRGSTPVEDAALQQMTREIIGRLEVSEQVSLKWNRWSIVPMSVGLFRSTVLLPVEAKEWTLQHREAVLLHELAHVKRRDCLVQLLAHIACALHWFNPLAWVAARQLCVEREHACDDVVLAAGTKASAYAEVLLEAARSLRSAAWSAPAAMAMARRSQLEGRLLAILDSDTTRRRFRRGETVLAVALVAAITLPLTAMHPAPGVEQNALMSGSSLPLTEEATPGGESAHAFSDLRSGDNAAASPESEMKPAGAAAFIEPEPTADAVGEARAAMQPGQQVEVVDTLTIEQLIRLRQFGVDAEYIRSLRALGYDNLSVDDLIEAAKFGIDPEYVQSMTTAGFANQTLDALIQLRKFGVDAEFVRGINTAGYTGLSAEELVELRKFGVEPDKIATLNDLGYGRLPLDDLVSLSKFGVDPEFIAGMREAGYEGLSVDDLVRVRKYGVDPDYVREMKAAGLENATLDQLIELRKRGIDAEFIHSMQEEN